VTTSVNGHRGVTQYLLQVEEEDLVRSLSLLIELYGITLELTEPYEGPCPACETDVKGAVECPDCGLSLSVGTPEASRQHPFYAFLESKGLLPNAAP